MAQSLRRNRGEVDVCIEVLGGHPKSEHAKLCRGGLLGELDPHVVPSKGEVKGELP